MFSAGLPAILPELVQAVSASTVTTAAGAEALLTCERLEAMLVPSDGRLDINGDEINVGSQVLDLGLRAQVNSSAGRVGWTLTRLCNRRWDSGA
jgi:hypothetical protein